MSKTPAGTADRGKHVDEERRAALRPVKLADLQAIIRSKGL
jgi:hypothetical protein